MCNRQHSTVAWASAFAVGVVLAGVDVLRAQGTPPGLRTRIAGEEGVFLVYDAAIPPTSPRGQAGYLGYWNEAGSDEIYVFGRLLFTEVDVGHALLNLDRDLWIDSATLAAAVPLFAEGLAEAAARDEDAIVWSPATRRMIFELMGFDPPAAFAGEGSDGLISTQAECGPCTAGTVPNPGPGAGRPEPPARWNPPAPPPGLSPDDRIDFIIQAIKCPPCGEPGPGGGGGNPPSSCVCCSVLGADAGDAGTISSTSCCESTCDDGNPCTENDLCQTCPIGDPQGQPGCCGTPQYCDDGNACTDDNCQNGACQNVPNVRACDDSDPCTINDTCSGGACAGTLKDCDDHNECTEDSCVEGACQNPPIAGPCPDDGNPCTDDICQDGACTHPNKPNCTPCPDGKCVNGACRPNGACCFFSTGTCSVTAQQCCQDQGGTYLGPGTVCLPPDLCQPVCENCHTVSAVVYECFHFVGPALPCGTAACIVNTINTATCDLFSSRIGPPNCNTKTLSTEPWVVQEVRTLVDSTCANYWPGDFHVWMERFYGCGSECVQDDPIKTRCDTFGCEGEFDFTQKRYPRRACGCP